jgi:hypothetical protein
MKPDKTDDAPALELNSATLVAETPKAAAIERPIASAGPPAQDDDAFDWDDDDAVLLGSQPSIAIYRGGAGHVVIRQERRMYDDEEAVVLILPENLDRVIKRLTALRNGAD